MGQEITFDSTLRNNNGPDTANNAAVTVNLPVGLTYTGATPSVGSFDSGSGIWTVGNLARDNVVTLKVTATVDAGSGGQTLTVTSLISNMDESDPDGTNNTASTDIVVTGLASADLALTASWDDSAPDEGQTVQLHPADGQLRPSIRPGYHFARPAARWPDLRIGGS